MIKFDVQEEDTFSNDQVGYIEVTVSDIIPQDGEKSAEHELKLMYGLEEAGTLKIQVEFEPVPQQ